MKELSQHEVDLVSGADLKGMIHGFWDGAATGMAIGGTWGGSGGFLFGALAQLGGITLAPIMGAAMGTSLGLIHDAKTVAGILADFRANFGSRGRS
ncbi:hypothetical protein C4K38_4269 [Pseudomonas chlororaphis subsp. piscium]|uniref:DUF5862 family protein n=1 Tax=Pseudomonas chlororaphis TaxID=587753 RepID=UPI0006A5A8D3|nr:hypothetical protein [Pseudomonas chlororaphis]AZC32221.1 hypothetical protein C4K38_4269 [Pseudomonas chlororaphis subsp. piscium]WDG89947.1 hypothetical protein PUP49_22010 [Pseudomonas chlororaphis]SDS70574.1 hypothetical protein SAMN05216585_3126 [Pseudomonas chlororaphis]